MRALIMQTLSGIIYTALPLAVAICTFTTYVALGNNLDVATALTSLALFEILRFPLFMLPMIITNLVEAKVSVDRIQSFLLEAEKVKVPESPLLDVGIKFSNATLVYDSIRKRLTVPTSVISHSIHKKTQSTNTNNHSNVDATLFSKIIRRISIIITFTGQVFNILFSRKTNNSSKNNLMTDIEFELLIRRAQVDEMEKRLQVLEISHKEQKENNEITNNEGDKSGERILTLFRVSLEAHRGYLFCIVGKVGSGKVFIIIILYCIIIKLHFLNSIYL